MKVRYTPEFHRQYKKLSVRISRQFDKTIKIFEKNHMYASLYNHLLRDEWEGYRGINIGDPKNDWRAVYEELIEGNESVARFVAIGTHKELFQDE